MKIRKCSTTLILAGAMTGVLGLSAGPAMAQQTVHGYNCQEEREVPAQMLTEPVYRRLSRIFEEIGEENYAEAYSGLQSMMDRRMTDYERASAYQAMGFIRAQQERWRDAIGYMNQALQLDVMPNSQQFEMILQTAQLYNILEDYDAALRQLDIWFCVVPEDQTKQIADVWVLKSSLHIQNDQYREALDSIDTAISLSDEPHENWYRIKLGMHFELNEYPQVIQVLKILIDMNPDRKDYWIQMAGAYVELGQELEAKSALSLAYRRGLLERQSEFMQLAGLIQAHGAPRQAAEVLADGIERGIVEGTKRNWEMLAGAWYEARNMQNALDAYEQAGLQSTDGALDLQRAFILINDDRWEEAIEALDRAIEKGGLSQAQEGNAYLLSGTAHFNIGNLQRAEEAFNRAANYGRLRDAAREWLNHIREERSRRAQL